MSVIPSSGFLAASTINVALGRMANNQFSFNDTEVRSLAGVSSGQLSFNNFYGKSRAPPVGNVLDAIFELNFGSATIPTTDTFGNTLTTSSPVPTMFNDATRGHVLSTIDNRYLYTTNNILLPASYTKMGWIYPTINQIHGNLLSSHNFNPTAHYIWYPNGTNMSAGHTTNGNVIAYVSDPSPVLLNTWVHFAVTYDNNTRTMILYKNGVNVSSTTNNNLAWSGANGPFGVGEFGSGNVFIGYLDNVRAYSRALTSSEILSIYNAERT